jgi:predicted NUDIX family NTP pyrophosphohydrolase
MKLIMENWRGYLKEATKSISYGVLPYRIANDRVEFLLGLVPQESYWTVFKGAKESDEDEHSAAKREFTEETSFGWPSDATFDDNKVLSGKTRNKELKIWLVEMSTLDINGFDSSKVVPIDSGQWAGQPEIVKIEWMDGDTAMARMPKSQKSMIKQAEGMIQ